MFSVDKPHIGHQHLQYFPAASSPPPTSSFTSERDSNDAANHSAHGRGRVRGRPKGRGVPSSSPSSQPVTPPRKRRRTKEEILAEQFGSAQTPRSTRQSARILSKRRATDPSPNVGLAAEQLPKAASMEPNLPPLTCTDGPLDALSFDPTIPDAKSRATSNITSAPIGRSAHDHADTTESNGLDDSRDRLNSEDEQKPCLECLEHFNQERTDDTSNIKPDEARENENNADVDAGPSRSLPALTITTDLASTQSTDIETPVGLEPPISALSMSPVATQSEAADLSASTVPITTTRARGGGRPRGKGKAKRAAPGRKPGGIGKGAPKMHLHDRNLSPSATAAVKKLRDRQKELHHAFRRVASVQRAALVVLATRSESRLIKDPKAHMDTPLYQEVLDDLQDRLDKSKALIDKEYELKAQCQNTTREAYEHWVKSAFKVSNILDWGLLFNFCRLKTNCSIGEGRIRQRRTHSCRTRKLSAVPRPMPSGWR